MVVDLDTAPDREPRVAGKGDREVFLPWGVKTAQPVLPFPGKATP